MEGTGKEGKINIGSRVVLQGQPPINRTTQNRSLVEPVDGSGFSSMFTPMGSINHFPS